MVQRLSDGSRHVWRFKNREALQANGRELERSKLVGEGRSRVSYSSVVMPPKAHVCPERALQYGR